MSPQTAGFHAGGFFVFRFYVVLRNPFYDMPVPDGTPCRAGGTGTVRKGMTKMMKHMKRNTGKWLAVFAALMLTAGGAASGAGAEGTDPVYSASDLFTSRDLKQEADLSGAERYTLSDGQELRLTAGGIYVLTGNAQNVSVIVEAGAEDKVQLVLDGLNVTNRDFPVIYGKSCGKLFVTTASDSSLSVTGSFVSDGDVHPDGVIFSKSDLTLNGTAALTISSSDNGIVGKDDLRITGGSYMIQAASKAVEANDSIRIAGGTLDLSAGTDGLHAENDEDGTLGYVYIGGGSIAVRAGDDGVHAVSVLQIDGGSLTVRAAEGMEGTYVQINGGQIDIQASDDGINAGRKSNAYSPAVVINGGDITVTVGAGDTDGIDSNGDIIVNGGTVRVNGNSTFDCDGNARYNGGTIIANGQQIQSIPNQMMGRGGGNGGRGGMDGAGGFGGYGGRNGRRGW